MNEQLYSETWSWLAHEIFLGKSDEAFVRGYVHWCGRWLEAGCGNGRLARSIQSVPHVRVDGFDLSKTAIDMCLGDGSLHGDFWVQSLIDNLPDNLLGSYDGISLMNRTLNHVIEPREQAAVLMNLSNGLAPGGVLLLDVMNPLGGVNNTVRSDRVRIRVFPNIGTIELQETFQRDVPSQLIHVKRSMSINGVPEGSDVFSMRWAFPNEVFGMVFASGLIVESVFGDYDKSPFAAGSAQMIVVARKM